MTDTSLSAILKAAYPAQYYGISGGTPAIIKSVYDVWSGTDNTGMSQNITGLPAADQLVSLTADQFAQFSASLNMGVDENTHTLLYPARFYARYDNKAAQPTGVTGWYDTWEMSTTSALPPAPDMVALTSSEWEVRMTGPQGVQGNALVSYSPPPVLVPLPQQAQNEMSWITEQASMAGAMGETFSDAMKAYVKAIKAIANGTDTTSQSLPARPTAVFSDS